MISRKKNCDGRLSFVQREMKREREKNAPDLQPERHRTRAYRDITLRKHAYSNTRI